MLFTYSIVGVHTLALGGVDMCKIGNLSVLMGDNIIA